MHFVDLTDADLPEVMTLNESSVPAVGDVSRHRMQWLLELASLALGVRDEDGRLVAFVVCMPPGSAYGSPNYRFFDGRYDSFVYVDRVVVTADVRSQGLGGRLYDEVIARSPGVRLMTAEVNLIPPNPGSMRFHERRGFKRVGVMESLDATYRVQYLAAPLT